MNYLRIPWLRQQRLGDVIHFEFGRSRRRGVVVAYVPGFVIVRYARERKKSRSNSA